METFTELIDFVSNPHYGEQRRTALGELDLSAIDAPIVDTIAGLSMVPYCFTLQSCYGHFLYPGQRDPHNIAPLPTLPDQVWVEYRIAYLALCIQEGEEGRDLLRELRKIPDIDPGEVQFGCATWFWERQVNSYVLQVEPELYKSQDRARIRYRQALHLQETRARFWDLLRELVERRSS
jgi:hypothetical protein